MNIGAAPEIILRKGVGVSSLGNFRERSPWSDCAVLAFLMLVCSVGCWDKTAGHTLSNDECWISKIVSWRDIPQFWHTYRNKVQFVRSTAIERSKQSWNTGLTTWISYLGYVAYGLPDLSHFHRVWIQVSHIECVAFHGTGTRALVCNLDLEYITFYGTLALYICTVSVDDAMISHKFSLLVRNETKQYVWQYT